MSGKRQYRLFPAFFLLSTLECAGRNQGVTLLGQTPGGAGSISQSDEYLELIRLGDGQLAAGKAAAALGTFERAARRQPDYWLSHNRIGQALMSLGRLDEAIQSLEGAHVLLETPANHESL